MIGSEIWKAKTYNLYPSIPVFCVELFSYLSKPMTCNQAAIKERNVIQQPVHVMTLDHYFLLEVYIIYESELRTEVLNT